jgi:hypothetical protein
MMWFLTVEARLLILSVFDEQTLIMFICFVFAKRVCFVCFVPGRNSGTAGEARKRMYPVRRTGALLDVVTVLQASLHNRSMDSCWG